MKGRWINALSVALAVVYGFAGTAKLLGAEMMAERFAMWGYPEVVMFVVGMIEVLGAVGLLIPKFASPAAIMLVLVMLGAMYTHLFRGFAPLAIVPAVFVALLASVAKRRLNTPQSWILSWRREVGAR